MKQKAKLWLPAIALTMLIYGCAKEDFLIVDSTELTSVNSENNSSNRFLTLTQNEYDHLKIEIEDAFRGVEKPVQQNTFDLTNNTTSSSTVIPENLDDMYAVNGVDQIIRKNEDVIAKFSNLVGHRSMLTVYNEALQIKDEIKLKNFVNEHNYFLTYIEEFNSVLLSVPRYKAALLNPNGIIKIDNNIIQYTDENIKIIKDGDVNLIDNLSAATRSNEVIEVIKFEDSSERAFARIKSIPTIRRLGSSFPQNLFAVVINKFIDTEPISRLVRSGPGGTTITIQYGARYKVGTECTSFFNDAPIASEIGLTSISSYNGGPAATDGAYTGSGIAISAFAPYTNPPPFGNLNRDLFAVVSGFSVTYINGVVFAGVE